MLIERIFDVVDLGPTVQNRASPYLKAIENHSTIHFDEGEDRSLLLLTLWHHCAPRSERALPYCSWLRHYCSSKAGPWYHSVSVHVRAESKEQVLSEICDG